MHDHEYIWAPQVAAALLEINASNLAKRIATAERALSERLANHEAPDWEERLKIRDAQNALRELTKEMQRLTRR
jgi:hypothetical protein